MDSSPDQEIRGLLDLALRIEKNGASFYRRLAAGTSEPQARSLFLDLADQEEAHYAFFTGLKDEELRREWPAGRRALVEFADRVIFGTEWVEQEAGLQTETAPAGDGLNRALRFALRRELDSIVFYGELRKLLPAGPAAALDRIISAEQGHYQALDKMMKNLDQPGPEQAD